MSAGTPPLVRDVLAVSVSPASHAHTLVTMIAAVLFDLYETLVTERHTSPVRASSLGERLGLDATAFRNAWKAQRVRVIHGHVSFADALLEIGVMLGRRLDVNVVRRLSDERRLAKAALFQRFDPVAIDVLRELHGRGCRLAVISNCFEEDVAAWPQCPVAACFDSAVFSFEVGTAKPEPPIYIEAMRRLDVDSSHAVFIGDGGDDELLGAERTGLRAAQAAWFRGGRSRLPSHTPSLSSWPAVLQLATAG